MENAELSDVSPDPCTVAAVAGRVLAGLQPGREQEQATDLRRIGVGLFHSTSARRRIARTVVGGSRQSVPGGFGAEDLDLLAQTVLLILNGVATDALSDFTRKGLQGAGGWLRRRALARALGDRAAPQRELTPVPQLPPATAREVGDLAMHIALLAGVTGEQAQLLANLLTAELSRRPGQ